MSVTFFEFFFVSMFLEFHLYLSEKRNPENVPDVSWCVYKCVVNDKDIQVVDGKNFLFTCALDQIPYSEIGSFCSFTCSLELISHSELGFSFLFVYLHTGTDYTLWNMISVLTFVFQTESGSAYILNSDFRLRSFICTLEQIHTLKIDGFSLKWNISVLKISSFSL